jgi:exodeoxyribonuclease VII small subunit
MSPREPKPPRTDAPPESFEAALARLEELVSELEAGDVPLEKSLHAFEEGQRLIKYCEQQLQAAEKALKQLGQNGEKTPGDSEDSHGS